MGSRGAKPPQSDDHPHETAAGLTGGGHVPDGHFVDDSQSTLVDAASPQDSYDPRAKATRHGKVTADKVNQSAGGR